MVANHGFDRTHHAGARLMSNNQQLNDVELDNVSAGFEGVLIQFEAGDMRSPVTLGNLWQGNDPPPQTGGGTKRLLGRPH
jgi:hypothetical protein